MTSWTSSDSDHITTRCSDGVLEVTLNRPGKRNALTMAMERHYYQILDRAEGDDSVRAVVVSGNGSVFTAGHDIGDPELVSQLSDGQLRRQTRRALPPDWYFSKPLIAAVHGYVGPGGFEMTASADFIIAAEKTRWGFEFVRKAAAAPRDTFYILSYQLPMRVLYKLWMMGGWFEAEEALAWNFIQRVVPANEVRTEARRWALETAKIPGPQYAAAKQGLRRFYEMAGLLVAAGAPDITSAQGNETANAFWRQVQEGGLENALRQRDVGFDEGIAKI